MNPSTSLSVRKSLVLATLALFVLIAVIAMRPAQANAAYNILDYKLTPTTTQAGGHPSFHYHVDPDAQNADQTGGDDLRKVFMEFPPGLLGNPEAVTSKCSTSNFNNNSCPDAAQVGTMKIVVRFTNGSTMNMTGKVHVLQSTTSGSAATIGFTVKPSNSFYRLIFLKTEVAGVVGVRSGTEGDYGLNLTVDQIPRTLTTIINSQVNATIADISVDMNARAGKPQSNGASPTTGKYFIFNPTRCTASPSKATITSYAGVVNVRSDSYTPTGCASVPFSPTSSYNVVNKKANQSTAISATFTVPTADATIQQSHVRHVQTDLPTGTRLDFPAIGAVPALCSEADLNIDACPAGSKIGNVSAAVPFLPPTMTGDVYMLERSTKVVFGYILRGGPGNSVKAPLKGEAIAVDADNNGTADFVRAMAIDMPQAPWSTATINFTTPLVRNPSTCGSNTIKTKLTGWSGAVVNQTSSYTTTDCATDTIPPVVNITAPANGATVTSASVLLTFTATDNSGTPTCNRTSGTFVTVVPGSNTISVTCTDAAGNATTASVTVTYVPPDITPPTISNVSPADNSSTAASSVTLTYTATDNSGAAPSCSPASGTVIPLSVGLNTITITCSDAAGNTASATTRVTRTTNPPVVVITSPTNNSNSQTTPINVAYTVNGSTTIPASTTCTVNGTASTSATTNSRPIVGGPNTITVSCTNADGTDTKSVTVNGVGPAVAITSPVNGANVTASSVNVAYTVNGGTTIPGGVTCTVNGASSTTPSTNSVALVLGANTITVVCTGPLGSNTAAVTVNRGDFLVTIVSPANGSTSTVSPINVAYTINGSTTIPAGTTCTVNGTASTSATTNARTIVAGANTITVSCTNAFGTFSANATVTGVAPSVVITSPPNGTNTTASSINVAYQVNGASTIPGGTTCTVNGAASSSTTTNNTPLPLTGVNTITVTCTSSIGSGSASVTVNRGGVPVVAITSPANGSNTFASSVNVAYTVNSAASIPAGTTCTVNGAASTSATTNSVTVALGPNTITVECSNSFGTGTPATVTVNGFAPSVTISAPANGSNTTAATTNVVYTVNGGSTIPAGITCTVNGAASTSTSTNSVALALGVNTLTVSCGGGLGSDTKSVTVTRGNVPVVAITSPTNNSSVTTSPVNVTYTVNGAGTIPAGTTCQVNSNPSTDPNNNPVPIVAGANTITVQCTNAFGPSTTQSVTVFLGSTPVSAITSPANGTNTTNASINVAYTVNGSTTIPAGTTCQVNGASSTSTTTNSVALATGANTINVQCTNSFGAGNTASVTVNRGTAPVVTITAPANNSNTTNPSANVAYTVTGSPPITCTVNGAASSSTTTNPITLVPGANTIVVSCNNAFGTGSASVTVNLGTAPDVVITSPANGTNTTNASINVAFTVNGSTTIAAGTNCTVNAAATSSATTNNVALAVGANTITVSCSNPFGSDSDVITVNRGSAPVVVITSPANNTNTSATSINVAFTVNGVASIPAGTTCQINAVNTSSATTNNVALNPGANTITVLCTNSFGPGSATITVTSGNTPAVAITSPPTNPTFTTAASINVAYTVNGAASIPAGTTCQINGSSSTSATANNFALAVGANTINVQCTNSFGPGNTATVTVNRGTAPDVTITSPSNGSSSTVTPINVAYSVTGTAPITCTINGNASSSTTTNSVTLAAGANTITVACSNAYGTDTDVITVNGVAPTVAITSPANGTNTTASSINVAYTVNGSASIPAGNTCTVNGASSTSATTNSVALSIGANPINVVCNNAFGPSNTATVTVNRGNTPVVAITAPATGSSSTTTPINVSYTIDGGTTIPAGTTCQVNSTSSTSTTTNSRAIVAGANTITAQCTNAFGAGNLASITVNGVAPTVVITAPTPNPTNTSASSINVAYTVNGGTTIPGGTTCTVNGASSTSTSTNNVALAVGSNTITVSCVGQLGTGTATTVVIRGNQPVVVITAPANGSSSTTTPINVAYTVDGSTTIPAGTTCQVNSTSSTSATTNSRAIVAGANTITAQCTNSFGAGNLASITVNGVAPTVAITSPATNPFNTTAASINVAYTVNGGTTIPAGTTCTVNGNSSTSTTTNNVALAPNTNNITVSCVGQLGTGTATTVIVRGSTPVVAITAPANGSNSFSNSINVAYTVDGSTTIPGGTTCQVNGTSSTSATTNARTIVVGANTVTAQCSNAFGTGNLASITVNGVAPVVAITSPANGTNTTATSINVTYTVNGGSTIPAGVSCTVNGASSTSTTTNSVALSLGANTITVSCTGSFGTSNPSITVNRGNPPVVAITAPANGSSSTTTPINVAYTVDGSTTIPAGTTCQVNSTSSTSATTNSRAIVAGANTITAQCTNAFGTGNLATVTVNGVGPTVVITSPANGGSTTASSVNVTYTVNGGSTIPAGTTCTVNSVASTSTSTNNVALAVGLNTITVSCSSTLGSGSNAITFTRNNVVTPPNTTITTFPAPSSPTDGTRAVSFTTDTGTSFECRMNSNAFASCSSAWTLPLSGPGIVQGQNTYDVRAVNSGGPDATPARGYIWVDDRPFSASPTVTPQTNDIVTSAAAVNDAGAHPDISATLDVEGYDDPQSVVVKFPDGLMGSLKAIPEASRCTVAQADSGTCPAASRVGVISGTAESPTDGLVSAVGTLYLVEAAGLDPSYAAGVAAEFDTITGPVSGDLGDIIAKGGLRLTDQARNITTEITDIPRVTTTGRPFHITTVSLTVEGDAGPSNANPLITNPHFCNDAAEPFTARPNYYKFVGSGTGYYGGITPEITADYIVDNCAGVPFAPDLDLSLTNPVAGASTGLGATVTLPTDNSTLRGIVVKLPSFMALDFPSFGVASDMCSGADDGTGAANNVSPLDDEGNPTFPAYYSFDASSCPPQSRVGQATITTPLLDDPVTGYLYLIDKAPVPWLGIDVNPSIPGNPQGVNIGLVGFNSTPCEDGSSTPGCQQVVQSVFNSVPDVPVTSVDLDIGGVEGRISDDGGIALSPDILKIAGANASSCKNSGTAATADFNPWSGTGISTVVAPLAISGCNDPKINITAPVVPTTGARINNVANTVTTSALNFQVNGSTTIPAGITCNINGTPTSTTTNTVSLVTGVNNFTISCSDAFGTGTATRRIDRGVPSIRFATPTATSTTAASVTSTLGVTANGVVLSGALPGTSGTTCNINGVNVANLTTPVTIPLNPGPNTLTATCTNSFGTGTATTQITRN